MSFKVSWPMVGCTLLPNVGGWAGGLIVSRNLKPWYESLKKPTWGPPNWVFGPTWTVLYCSMGYASYLVIDESESWEKAALPLSVYGLNLALNWAWTPIFFGMHKIKWAMYELAATVGCTAVLGMLFHRATPNAGYLIAPYLMWTSYALAVNYAVYRDNEATNETISEEKKN